MDKLFKATQNLAYRIYCERIRNGQEGNDKTDWQEAKEILEDDSKLIDIYAEN